MTTPVGGPAIRSRQPMDAEVVSWRLSTAGVVVVVVSGWLGDQEMMAWVGGKELGLCWR